MQLRQKHKIWGSRVLGVVAFACSLVLTPRLFVDSSASASSQIPVQSIQPFGHHDLACPNCAPGVEVRKHRCLTDTPPDHTILWNSSDDTDLSEYTDCENSDSPNLAPVNF